MHYTALSNKKFYMRSSAWIGKVASFFCVVVAMCVLGYFILFTRYAPDAYVLVRYAAVDNIERTISIQSILDNNFVFDVLTVVGDALRISSPEEYLVLTASIYCMVFIFKYYSLLKVTTFSRTALIFVISFFTFDLNMLRFNLSVMVLLYPLIFRRQGIPVQYKALSLLIHVLPLAVYVLKKLYYLPIFAVFVFASYLDVGDSRLFQYLDDQQMAAFKSLLYFIPVLIAFFIYKKSCPKNDIMEIVEALAVLGLLCLPFNTAISARFVESAFYLCALWWVIYSRNQFLGVLFWLFAIASFISRYYGGINAGENDFIF